MVVKSTDSDIPHIRLVSAQLIGLTYRAKTAEREEFSNSQLLIESGEYSVSFKFSHKKQKGFKVKVIFELTAQGVKLKATHDAQFSHSEPMTKDQISTDINANRITYVLMPLYNELITNLSGKSFLIPMVGPTRLSIDLGDEQENTV